MLLLFSSLVVSGSLQPDGLQQARLCPVGKYLLMKDILVTERNYEMRLLFPFVTSFLFKKYTDMSGYMELKVHRSHLQHLLTEIGKSLVYKQLLLQAGVPILGGSDP